MPMVYTLALATPGNSATNSSANTENPTWTAKPGARNVALQAMYVTGKGAGLTAISGIIHRLRTYGTASTSAGGTAITPTPKDPGMQAATAVCFSNQTLGSTPKNNVVFGSGAAGPGGWVAPNPDSVILVQGSAALSVDAVNASGTVSLNFEWSAEIVE